MTDDPRPPALAVICTGLILWTVLALWLLGAEWGPWLLARGGMP